MTQSKNLVKPKSRLNWNDLDWATYLDCPVQKIPEYKRVLDANYVTAVERNRTTGRYSFAMYKYHTKPSGDQNLQLLLSDDKHSFPTIMDAVHDANNIISTMELSDFWAKALGMPARAVQMMLIREK